MMYVWGLVLINHLMLSKGCIKSSQRNPAHYWRIYKLWLIFRLFWHHFCTGGGSRDVSSVFNKAAGVDLGWKLELTLPLSPSEKTAVHETGINPIFFFFFMLFLNCLCGGKGSFFHYWPLFTSISGSLLNNVPQQVANFSSYTVVGVAFCVFKKCISQSGVNSLLTCHLPSCIDISCVDLKHAD